VNKARRGEARRGEFLRALVAACCLLYGATSPPRASAQAAGLQPELNRVQRLSAIRAELEAEGRARAHLPPPSCDHGGTVCGMTCAVLGTDPNNCGGCGHRCRTQGATCMSGLCSDEFQPLASWTTPTQISGGDPTTTCMLRNEAAPVSSATWSSSSYYAHMYAPSNVNRINWASAYNSWASSDAAIPLASSCSGCTAAGDMSAATSAYTGLEYVAQIVLNSSNKMRLGIAVTSASLIPYNWWSYPTDIVLPTEFADGPTVHYDQGGTTLWATSMGWGYTYRLHSFKNCFTPSRIARGAGPVVQAVRLPTA